MVQPLRPSTGVSRSTTRVRLLVFSVVVCILAVAVSKRTTFHGSIGTMMTAVGFVLVVLAALGRLWTSLFIAGFKDTVLVRTGPYAAARHPLYALSLLGIIGIGLGTRSVTLLLTLGLVAILLHARAMRAEDASLESTHGEAARNYQATVPSLWPAWSKYSVPATLEIRPPIVWKAVLDAASLLLAFGLVHGAHQLQQTGATPTWFSLP